MTQQVKCCRVYGCPASRRVLARWTWHACMRCVGWYPCSCRIPIFLAPTTVPAPESLQPTTDACTGDSSVSQALLLGSVHFFRMCSAVLLARVKQSSCSDDPDTECPLTADSHTVTNLLSSSASFFAHGRPLGEHRFAGGSAESTELNTVKESDHYG